MLFDVYKRPFLKLESKIIDTTRKIVQIKVINSANVFAIELLYSLHFNYCNWQICVIHGQVNWVSSVYSIRSSTSKIFGFAKDHQYRTKKIKLLDRIYFQFHSVNAFYSEISTKLTNAKHYNGEKKTKQIIVYYLFYAHRAELKAKKMKKAARNAIVIIE